ncbi:MAG: GntR family transcriptional regulator [Pseudomonadota bacterium]
MGRKDEIRRRIRLKILLSEIPPGAVLDEEALAAEFGVSRTPIREICAHLVAEGTASYLRGRGACVPSVTSDAIDGIFEAVGSTYPAVFGLACERIDALELVQLRGLYNGLVALTPLGPRELRAGRYLDFMALCADASRNPYLARSVHQLVREECRHAIAMARLAEIDDVAATPLERLVAACGPILGALERRDAVALTSALDARLAATRDAMFRRVSVVGLER